MQRQVIIYDTTLRDGTQGEYISLSAEDKLRIARKLDEFGIHYIEGGWPGSNPKDARFFEMAKLVTFKNSRLTAFGSTRKANIKVEEDENIKALLNAGVDTVTIFGKSWDLHVTEILATTLEENLRMIYDSISYLKEKGKEVIYDAEHFFDGYKNNKEYTLKTIKTAIEAGADYIVFCDTNGGTMPHEIEEILKEVLPKVDVYTGIHAHNDSGLAVANSITAVRCGVDMVQGTINGYGERCGNADLIPIIANLQLKMGYRCIPPEKLKHLTELSRFVSEIANMPPFPQRPFVGKSAFAHKAGVHVSAIIKNPSAYEHIDPSLVGNRRRVLVSDLSGKSNIEYKAKELGVELSDRKYSKKIVEEIKKLEDKGYYFEAAEGSLFVLMKRFAENFEEPFKLQALRVGIEKNGAKASSCHATIKITVGNEEEITAAEGDGPVNALDNALRKALSRFFPNINEMKLVDFKVRVIDGTEGTAAKVRVQIESRDENEIWTTIGVSENIIEASWQALVDSILYKLIKDREKKKQKEKEEEKEEKKYARESDNI
ncbi:MAG: citramalate synthase [Deltaproteobacteria bacterium]|nr:MAG: citramalate synthase [Deltaproteobacteria bacterium]